jgi:hypothetical protein
MYVGGFSFEAPTISNLMVFRHSGEGKDEEKQNGAC